jgi:hypothetical protein
MTLSRKLQALRSIGRLGGWRLTEALVLSGLVPLGFHYLGVPRTQALLRSWALSHRHEKPQDWAAAVRTSNRALQLLRRRKVIEGTCLSRSLILWAILLRQGIQTELRIGFRKQAGTIEGHAWIECDGNPVNESMARVRTYTVSENLTSFDEFRHSR